MTPGYPVYHCKEVDDIKACNGIAFYYRDLLVAGDIIMSEKAVFVDGTKPEPSSTIHCGHCNKPVRLSCLKQKTRLH